MAEDGTREAYIRDLETRMQESLTLIETLPDGPQRTARRVEYMRYALLLSDTRDEPRAGGVTMPVTG